jgi:hypothetical protein
MKPAKGELRSWIEADSRAIFPPPSRFFADRLRLYPRVRLSMCRQAASRLMSSPRGSGRSLNDQERRLRDVIRAVRLHRRLSVQCSDRDPLFEPGYSTFQPAKKEANVPNITTIADTPLVTLRSKAIQETCGVETRTIGIKFALRRYPGRRRGYGPPDDGGALGTVPPWVHPAGSPLG